MIESSDRKKINITWQVGLQVYLSKQIEGKEIKFTTQIVGWNISNFIIVHTPYLNGQPIAIDIGLECFIKLIDDGEAVGFECTVLKTQTEPTPLLFLSYPSTVKNISARKDKRFKTLLPVVIQTKDKGGNISASNGMILNLSSNGCLISTQNSYNMGEILFISFSLPTKDEINDLVCYINNIKESSETKFLGIEFEEKSRQKNKEKLDRFVNPIEEIDFP